MHLSAALLTAILFQYKYLVGNKQTLVAYKKLQNATDADAVINQHPTDNIPTLSQFISMQCCNYTPSLFSSFDHRSSQPQKTHES